MRGRHKKQTGGHGQFGDVVLEVEPLPRGAGFEFVDRITGGVVPRQYIPSVEHGVREALNEGPLGFPVVDVQVTLTDGSYHTVDSSDMAFRAAARLAMAEALPKAQPGAAGADPRAWRSPSPPTRCRRRAPSSPAAGARSSAMTARPGWDGWDVLKALMPESEIGDLIVELRSATSGVGSYRASLDHLAELTGKPAEAVVEAGRLPGALRRASSRLGLRPGGSAARRDAAQKKEPGHAEGHPADWSRSGSKPENRPEGNGPTRPQHREGKAETTTGTDSFYAGRPLRATQMMS